MVSRLLGSVEDDSRGETYASKMKLRLLKGKRKKEKYIKKENNLRDGESNCHIGLD